MKKSVFAVSVILVVVFIFGCSPIEQEYESHLKVVELEGCEYMVFRDSHGSVFVHKGNCKNPIHMYRTEKETVDMEADKDRLRKQALAKLSQAEKDILGIKE